MEPALLAVCCHAALFEESGAAPPAAPAGRAAGASSDMPRSKQGRILYPAAILGCEGASRASPRGQAIKVQACAASGNMWLLRGQDTEAYVCCSVGQPSGPGGSCCRTCAAAFPPTVLQVRFMALLSEPAEGKRRRRLTMVLRYIVCPTAVMPLCAVCVDLDVHPHLGKPLRVRTLLEPPHAP